MAEEKSALPLKKIEGPVVGQKFAGKPFAFWKELMEKCSPTPKPPPPPPPVIVKRLPKEQLDQIKQSLSDSDVAHDAFSNLSASLAQLNTEDMLEIMKAALTSGPADQAVDHILEIPEPQRYDLLKIAIGSSSQSIVSKVLNLLPNVPEEYKFQLLMGILDRIPAFDRYGAFQDKNIEDKATEIILSFPKNQRDILINKASELAIWSIVLKVIGKLRDSVAEYAPHIEKAFCPTERNYGIAEEAMKLLPLFPIEERCGLLMAALRSPSVQQEAVKLIPAFPENKRGKLAKAALESKIADLDVTELITGVSEEEQAGLVQIALASSNEIIALEGAITAYCLKGKARNEEVLIAASEWLNSYIKKIRDLKPRNKAASNLPDRYDDASRPEINHVEERIINNIRLIPEVYRGILLEECCCRNPSAIKEVAGVIAAVPPESRPGLVRSIILSQNSPLDTIEMAELLRVLPEEYRAAIMSAALVSEKDDVKTKAADMVCAIKDLVDKKTYAKLIQIALIAKMVNEHRSSAWKDNSAHKAVKVIPKIDERYRLELVKAALHSSPSVALEGADFIKILPAEQVPDAIQYSLHFSSLESAQKALKFVSDLPQKRQIELIRYALESEKWESFVVDALLSASKLPAELIPNDLMERITGRLLTIYTDSSGYGQGGNNRYNLMNEIENLSEQIKMKLLEAAFNSFDKKYRKKAFVLLESLQEHHRPRIIAAALRSDYLFTRIRARRWRLGHRALEREYGSGKLEKRKKKRKMSDKQLDGMKGALADPGLTESRFLEISGQFDTMDDYNVSKIMNAALDSPVAQKAVDLVTAIYLDLRYNVIEKALKSKNNAVAMKAVDHIKDCAENIRFSLFLSALDSGNINVATGALRLFWDFPALARPALITEACKRIKKVDEKVASDIVEVMLRDNDYETAMAAAKAICSFAMPIRNSLMETALVSDQEAVRLEAVKQIAAMPSENQANLIWIALQMGGWTALDAVELIPSLPGNQGKELFTYALCSPSKETAMRAIAIASEMNLLGELWKLRIALEAPKWREASMKMLEYVDQVPENARNNFIISALDSQDEEVALKAMSIVESSRKNLSLLLEQALKSRWSSVAGKAVPMIQDVPDEFAVTRIDVPLLGGATKTKEILLPAFHRFKLTRIASYSRFENVAMDAFRLLPSLVMDERGKLRELEKKISMNEYVYALSLFERYTAAMTMDLMNSQNENLAIGAVNLVRAYDSFFHREGDMVFLPIRSWERQSELLKPAFGSIFESVAVAAASIIPAFPEERRAKLIKAAFASPHENAAVKIGSRLYNMVPEQQKYELFECAVRSNHKQLRNGVTFQLSYLDIVPTDRLGDAINLAFEAGLAHTLLLRRIPDAPSAQQQRLIMLALSSGKEDFALQVLDYVKSLKTEEQVGVIVLAILSDFPKVIRKAVGLISDLPEEHQKIPIKSISEWEKRNSKKG